VGFSSGGVQPVAKPLPRIFGFPRTCSPFTPFTFSLLMSGMIGIDNLLEVIV
jgi:hypothetical protein